MKRSGSRSDVYSARLLPTVCSSRPLPTVVFVAPAYPVYSSRLLPTVCSSRRFHTDPARRAVAPASARSPRSGQQMVAPGASLGIWRDSGGAAPQGRKKGPQMPHVRKIVSANRKLSKYNLSHPKGSPHRMSRGMIAIPQNLMGLGVHNIISSRRTIPRED